MLRMFARRLSMVELAANSDRVICGWSVPSDTVIHDIKIKVRGITTSRNIAQWHAHMTAAELWILPMKDPDTFSTYDNEWEIQVPKDTAVQTLDLDTLVADASPFFEPGEADWSQMIDVGFRPERLYHRHRIHTIQDSVFSYQDNQTPFALQWAGGDRYDVHIKRRLHVRQPSNIVLGVASPSLAGTTATLQGPLVENEWGQVKYASHMLERAMLHLFGLTEAGAETPWEEATLLLEKMLEPDPYEESAGFFTSEAYRFYAQGIMDFSVAGELGNITVTSGR